MRDRALLLVVLLMWPLAARAQSEPVTSTLKAVRIVREANGSEKQLPAANAEAGALLEYQLTYANRGSGKVTGLLATLPIPRGTAYVEGSSRPPRCDVSLDGKAFAPPPLTREEKQPDGSTRKVAVPASQYRFLRWSVPTLDKGQSVTLVARVRVLGAPPPPPRP